MATSTSQRTKRKTLTRDRVLDAAIGLADETGIENLTIRKLAAALQVKPMTIYHHVAGKEAIVDGMVDRVFSEIDRPPTDVNWQSAMRQRSLSARAVLAKHRWATPLMESRTNPGPETLAHHDAVVGCFRRSGFSVEMAAHAYALVDSFVYGFALQEASLPATGGEDMANLASSIIDPLPQENYPHLRELVADHVLQPGYDFGGEFEFGLDLILEGLEAARQRPS